MEKLLREASKTAGRGRRKKSARTKCGRDRYKDNTRLLQGPRFSKVPPEGVHSLMIRFYPLVESEGFAF